MTKEQGLTVASLKNVLPFATLLVAIVLAWTSLTSQIALLNERGQTTNDRLMNTGKKVDDLGEKQNEMSNELTRLATLLEEDRRLGSTGNSATFAVIPTFTPTPTPTPVTTIVNIAQADNSPKPQPTPEPTSTPEPPENEPSPITNLLDNIFNLL